LCNRLDVCLELASSVLQARYRLFPMSDAAPGGWGAVYGLIKSTLYKHPDAIR
jgi:hypothetical protein